MHGTLQVLPARTSKRGAKCTMRGKKKRLIQKPGFLLPFPRPATSGLIMESAFQLGQAVGSLLDILLHLPIQTAYGYLRELR